MTVKKNEALVFSGSLEAVATAGTFQVNPTLATGDFKTSKDGGALANLATLPTVTPAGGSLVQFSLSAAEMNGDHIVVVCKDAAGDEWRDVNFSTLTSTRDIDDLATQTSVDIIDGIVDDILVDTAEIGAAGAGLTVLSTQTSVDAVAAKTVNLPSDPADQSLIIEATDAILTAVNTRLATVGYTAPDNASIAAIKLQTDLIPAAPAAVGDIPTASENAAEYLKHDWTTVTGEADRSTLNAMRAIRNKSTLAAGTLTVTKEDDLTSAWAATVTTDATALPITGVDPT